MRLLYKTSSDWPGGISDGLTLSCGICGEKTNFDYTVKDAFWAKVIPQKMQKGVVCLDCVDRLAKENGEILSLHLEKVQYTGFNETIVLYPKIGFIY